MSVKRSELDPVLAGLVGELQPTAPLRRSMGALLFGIGGMAALLSVALGLGIRPSILAGRIDAIFLIAGGLFLLLGISAATTVIGMAQPQVGNRHKSRRWAAAMAAVLPAAAVLVRVLNPASLKSQTPGSVMCVGMSVTLGLIVVAALAVWLRRGAPTNPALAGMLIGVSGGSIGAFVFAFHCPCDDLFHVAIWHGAAVVVSGLIGRAVLPRFLRW